MWLLLEGTNRPTPGLRPVFDRLVSHGKPDSAWARVPFVSLRYYAVAPRGLRYRNRQRHLHLFLCEAQLLLRSRDGAPILPHRLQLLLVDEPLGVYRNARSRFVHHGIDFSKGFSIAHKPACVIVASASCWAMKTYPLCASSRREEELP